MKINNQQAGLSHVLLPLVIIFLVVTGFASMQITKHQQSAGIDTSNLTAKAPKNTHSTGHFIDVSKPQCDNKIYFRADRAVIGVNGYTSKTWNSCLKKQASLIRNYSLYVVASYNGERVRKGKCGQKTQECYAYNYGYKIGKRDFNHAKRKHVISTLWWIDVEEFRGGWGPHKELNREYLRGMSDALTDSGVRTVGYYSNSRQWGSITGGWLNGRPAWKATGSRPPEASSAVLEHCGRGFTGGPTWLVQYVKDGMPGGELDVNYACHSDFSNGL